jgi:PhnB protein
MQVTPYLNVDGKCAEAFRFYERVLGGKIEGMMTFGESPMHAEHVPADMRDRVMHARLDMGDGVLMGSDSQPGQHKNPQGMYISLNVEDPARAERIFHALADNGSVEMPIQKTFWAARFGMLVDRFGIPWMINCEQRA